MYVFSRKYQRFDARFYKVDFREVAVGDIIDIAIIVSYIERVS